MKIGTVTNRNIYCALTVCVLLIHFITHLFYWLELIERYKST